MLNTKQMDLAQKEKKNHLKISRPGDKNYLTTIEVESELNMQLLGNFQAENSYDHKYSMLK